MSAALAIARAFEAAWQGKDFEKARSYLAGDVVMNHPFGRETNAEAVIGQYTGISPVVTGPAKGLAGFGDDTTALIMYELPTSVFGTAVTAMRYVVRDGKITELTLVYDATAAKTQMQPQSS
jgi:SnoaL-like domain